MNLKLSPPWTTMISKITKLFEQDPQVSVSSNTSSDNPYITLTVSNKEKGEAIRKLLPSSIAMGNVTLKINVVIDTITDNNVDYLSLLNTAFSGNPVFCYTEHIDEAGFSADYCIWQREVVEFFNDDLSQISGNWCGLWQDICSELLQTENVYHCTDI